MSAAKKTTKSKKRPMKKTVKKPARKTSASRSKQPTHKSFKVSPNEPFMNFTVTNQTLYWFVLIVFIAAMFYVISKIQLDIKLILDVIT